jgi:NADH:ubiquinone oxidoreductase subunit 2 (subunit N)
VQIFIFLLPQLVLFLTVILVFGFDLVGSREKKWLPYLALIGAVISLGISIYLIGWGDIPEGTVLGGMISIDAFSLFFQVFAALVASLIILLSIAYMELKSPSLTLTKARLLQ